METCDPENVIQVITFVETVKNQLDDPKVLAEKIEVLKEETKLKTIIADGGFLSEDVIVKATENEVEFIATAIRGRSVGDHKLNSLSF